MLYAPIKLAMQADGKPVTDEARNAAMKRFETRLTSSQRTALRTWWKTKLEGGGA